MTGIKICGLRDKAGLKAAVESGADYVGFVFYRPSPRCIPAGEAAKLAQSITEKIHRVGLFVDPTDQDLETVLGQMNLDYVQLHGQESPKRALEIKQKFQIKIIKAIRIGSKKDLLKSIDYEGFADILMFDAKIDGAALPGGMGQVFDWDILQGYKPETPWMLAGGLTVENLSKALCLLHPDAVDVSSGVECAPGQKDPAKITEFIKAVKDHDKTQ